MDIDQHVEDIANLVKESYFKLSKTSRPTVRSNGIREGTIVASVIAIRNDTGNLRLISTATGVKATPNFELKRSNGKILHDCHAEILALRGLNSVILKHISFIKDGQESDLLIKSGIPGKFKWRDELKLVLFISKLPCGDASMFSLKESTAADVNQDNIHYSDSDESQYLDPSVRTILRGRSNFEKKGYVRSKPGRIDSKITFSKSCTDKLCIRQCSSVLNALTFSLLEVPIYLEYLIVPNLTKDEINYAKKSFHDRINTKDHLLDIVSCKFDFPDDLTQDNEPSPMSSIKIYYKPDDMHEEQILNGLKNGYYTKPSKPIRKNAQSIVSRYTQWSQYIQINPEFKDIPYLTLKEYCLDRKLRIDEVKKVLSPDGWVHTYDNFTMT